MSISISSNFTQRNYSWTEWKVIYGIKLFSYQFDSADTLYTIWGYDGPEISMCQIWTGDVPSTIIAAGNVTQEQNDLDKLDFENNFMANANQVIDKVEQQRNTIYQANLSNFYFPASSSANYYLAISLLNTDGYYRHPPGKHKLKIYSIDNLAAKTNMSDVWIIGIGVIVDLAPTTATVTFLNAGSIYLSNNGQSNSVLVNFDFPLYIDCEVTDNHLTGVAGGVTYPGVPNIGSEIPIINAAAAMTFPQIGDVIMSVACVSDITGFVPKTPTGACIFQTHFHYTVED